MTYTQMQLGTMFGVGVGVLLSFIMWYPTQLVPYKDTYQHTLFCNNGLKSWIVAEHVTITRKDGVYILERTDGHTMTYEKDAMSWCSILLDKDVAKP